MKNVSFNILKTTYKSIVLKQELSYSDKVFKSILRNLWEYFWKCELEESQLKLFFRIFVYKG